MTEEFCVLCAFYHPRAEKHHPDRKRTCEDGRRRLERDRLTVRSMYQRLVEEHLVDDSTGPNDPVGRLLPMAPTPGRSKKPTVSGSRERPLPIDVNTVDLTAAAQKGTVADPYGDQTGYASVATVLWAWVESWRGRFFPAESLPPATAERLLDWLGGVRLELVCELEPEIEAFAEELSDLRRALRDALHETPPRPQVMWSVPCRRCGLVSQLVLDPDDPDRYRECSNPECQLLMTETEYQMWLLEVVERLRVEHEPVADDVPV